MKLIEGSHYICAYEKRNKWDGKSGESQKAPEWQQPDAPGDQ